ncbi:SCA7-domain-containing protein [Massarina eburnea CBS 473.64]|uniref:SCA7-domain-containing protein n=1 Tax=Massarina eburnea CBS 473.64 TaxID=1395130 RepID=A0A6A6RWE0_9PLEO|nr:SCA7-domain-containing protein [Massarina eburnea CBS 473.64]
MVDASAVKEGLGEKEKKGMTIKIKKPAPKVTMSGNWKESEAVNVEKPTSTSATSPIVNPLDEKTLARYSTGHPNDDKLDMVQCKLCRRSMARVGAAEHIRECLNKKQEKLKKKKEAKEAKDAALRKEKGEDDDIGKNARKSAVKGAVVDGEGAKKGKKRKLEGEDGKPGAKKKKKDEPKAKTAKAKGPVDVEKQCGVPLPNGGCCARSLTCKSHSMGLKRAVPGRSLPYDMLLAQYQKKNQAKQQRAAIDANAPLPEDLEPSGAVDSDEETNAIMNVLKEWRPRPAAVYYPVSLPRKYQNVRMKGMLRSALGVPPSTANSMFTAGTPSDTINSGRQLALGMMGAPSSATAENFPNVGFGSTPLSAGLDGPNSAGGLTSRRQSGIGMGQGSGGPRQILPGQLPGPGPQQRKGSVASVGAA